MRCDGASCARHGCRSLRLKTHDVAMQSMALFCAVSWEGAQCGIHASRRHWRAGAIRRCPLLKLLRFALAMSLAFSRSVALVVRLHRRSPALCSARSWPRRQCDDQLVSVVSCHPVMRRLSSVGCLVFPADGLAVLREVVAVIHGHPARSGRIIRRTASQV